MNLLRFYVGEVINGNEILEELAVEHPPHHSHQQKHNNRMFRVKHLPSGLILNRSLAAMRHTPLRFPWEKKNFIDFRGKVIEGIEVIGVSPNNLFSKHNTMPPSKGYWWDCIDVSTGEECLFDSYALSLMEKRERNALRPRRVYCGGRPTKHGARKQNQKNYLYTTWQATKQRCHSPTYKHYKSYGAIGMSLCDEWFHDFKQFETDVIAEIGHRESNKFSLFVKEGLVYKPGNVEWVEGGTGSKCLPKRYADRLTK